MLDSNQTGNNDQDDSTGDTGGSMDDGSNDRAIQVAQEPAQMTAGTTTRVTMIQMTTPAGQVDAETAAAGGGG